MSIVEFAELAVRDGAKCWGGCGKPLKISQIRHYDHTGGWEVTGYDKKQWIFFHCDDCHYGTSLTKLGIRSH